MSQLPDDPIVVDQRLQEVEAQLTYEREQQLALRPYLVPKVRRGIVGTSRYADRLRLDIKSAYEGDRAVLIFGEPGLEKDNIASLILSWFVNFGRFEDRKSTRLNSSHRNTSRMPSSA